MRAFLDSNNNGTQDYWKSFGIADNELHVPFVVPVMSNVDIIITDVDTDNDRLPDAWEYQNFGNISEHSGYEAVTPRKPSQTWTALVGVL